MSSFLEMNFTLTAQETAKCVKQCTLPRLTASGARFDFVKGQKLNQEDKDAGFVLWQEIVIPKVERLVNHKFKVKETFRLSPEKDEAARLWYGYLSCAQNIKARIKLSCLLSTFEPGKAIRFVVSPFQCVENCTSESSHPPISSDDYDSEEDEAPPTAAATTSAAVAPETFDLTIHIDQRDDLGKWHLQVTRDIAKLVADGRGTDSLKVISQKGT